MKHVTHVRNLTDVPFITSDRPVLNIHESFSEGRSACILMDDYYFPLSPYVAVVMSDSDQYTSWVEIRDEKLIIDLNTKMKNDSFSAIFGSTESVLLDLMATDRKG